MWNNYFNRPRRNVPTPNYIESSEDEYDSPLVSPARPPPTRAGSPVELAVPTLQDNVDEELEAVRQTLTNVGHSHTFRGTRPAPGARPDPEGQLQQVDEPVITGEEEVVEGLVINESQNLKVDAENDNMADPFEIENGIDDAGAMKDASRNLERFAWDNEDLEFVFGQLEAKMAAAGVKKQFTKFQILTNIIPKEVTEEVKSILRKKETDFNNDAYKKLKDRIMAIFGTKPEAAIDRALGRVMSGRPSQLARALAEDICKKELDCECCPRVVMAIWRRHLPNQVKAGIAHCTLTKDTFDAVVQLADNIWASQGAVAKVAAVKQVAATPSLDETQPGLQYPVPEVAAVQRGGRGGGRGRGGFRGGGRGRGGQNSQSSQNSTGQRQSGAKHPDLPAGDVSKFCGMHFRWGRSAFFCNNPSSCPWKNVYIAKPAKNNSQ